MLTEPLYLQAGAHLSWGFLGGRNEEEEQSKKEEEQPVEKLGGLCLTWPGLVWFGMVLISPSFAVIFIVLTL